MSRVTFADAMRLIIAEDRRRRLAAGLPPSRYKPSQRVWIEPFFNLLGTGLGWGIRILPLAWRSSLLCWMCETVGGHPIETNHSVAERTSEVFALAASLHAKTGRWPAVLFLMTHAETLGPNAWIRFELMRQAMEIGNAYQKKRGVGPFGSHSQCFLAIDPFALDTVSPAVGGFYAGAMNQIHLCWDRQAQTQSWVQKHFLLRGTGIGGVAYRVLNHLRKGTPLLMILGGGLPENARLLYTAREFVYQLRPKQWPFPKRVAENQLMEIIQRGLAESAAMRNGLFSDDVRQKVAEWIAAFQLSREQCGELLMRLEAEFKRAVPFRQRLFSALASRLVRKGTPLLLMGLRHQSTSPVVVIEKPLGVALGSKGLLDVFSVDEAIDTLMTPEMLAQRVGRWFS